MHVFMILVVKARASVISWAGVCGDRLAIVVFRRAPQTSMSIILVSLVSTTLPKIGPFGAL